MKRLDTLANINGLIDDCENGFITEIEYCDYAYRLFQDAVEEYEKEYALEKYHWTDEDVSILEDGYYSWLDGEITEEFGSGNEFFEVLKELDCPCELLDPVPVGMECPRRTIAYTKTPEGYYCMWYVNFRCVDDDGLLSEDDPVGQTFVLTNEMGLEAELKVLNVRQVHKLEVTYDRRVPGGGKKLDVSDEDENETEYACIGYIEGYTSKKRYFRPDRSERPEDAYIFVYADASSVIYAMKVYPVMDDEYAIGGYPLWKEYFEWLDNKNRSIRYVLLRYKDRRTKGERS